MLPLHFGYGSLMLLIRHFGQGGFYFAVSFCPTASLYLFALNGAITRKSDGWHLILPCSDVFHLPLTLWQILFELRVFSFSQRRIAAFVRRVHSKFATLMVFASQPRYLPIHFGYGRLDFAAPLSAVTPYRT